MKSEWDGKLHELHNSVCDCKAALAQAKASVAEAVFHKDLDSPDEWVAIRAQKRLMERLPFFFAASIDHARAKQAIKEHRRKKPA